jgi:uncharacterized protein YbbK (DUF523 family)/uncharacterized protein YbgA (DUF1722 family)
MTPSPPDNDQRPRLGISACLLGDEVRFDGGHKRDVFLSDVLGPHVHWIRVCPEVEVGMGTPRETLRLERDRLGSIEMVTTANRIDHTDAMKSWAGTRLDGLIGDALDGYVLKKDSPSCGMDAVKVFDASGAMDRVGRGIFAEALLARFPNLPVEEEGRLADPMARDNFVERVFAHQRLRTLFDGPWTVSLLEAFHDRHRLTLHSHAPYAFETLRRVIAASTSLDCPGAPPPRRRHASLPLAANGLFQPSGLDITGGSLPMDAVAMRAQYEAGFMQALRIVRSPNQHVAALQFAARRLRPCLDARESSALRVHIDDYHRGRLLLVEVIALVRQYADQHAVGDLVGQTYLAPYPRVLAVCGHA